MREQTASSETSKPNETQTCKFGNKTVPCHDAGLDVQTQVPQAVEQAVDVKAHVNKYLQSPTTTRLTRRFSMLRTLFTCLTLVSLSEAASHVHVEEQQSSCAQRASKGEAALPVVYDGKEAAVSYEGSHWISAPNTSTCAGRLRPSHGVQGKGANQYGTWTKCLQCALKLEFTRYGPDNPRPTSRKSKPSGASTPAAQRLARAKASSTMTAALDNPLSSTEMNEALSQHARDLTATLAQALEPIVNSQRQIQDQMGYVQSQVMQAQMMHPGNSPSHRSWTRGAKRSWTRPWRIRMQRAGSFTEERQHKDFEDGGHRPRCPF